MPPGRTGIEMDQIPGSTQSQTVPVPAGGKILVDALDAFVLEPLKDPQDGVSPQARKTADPHRDAAAGKALGEDGTLRRENLLTVEPGSRPVQQQIHGKGRLIFFLGAAEHPAVVEHRHTPDPRGIQMAAAGNAGVGLLVDEDAVADLFGQAQHDAAVQLPVFGVVFPVSLCLQLRLLCQMLRLRGGSLLRAGRTGGEPEMAAQMIAGAKLLLRIAQAFRRVEGMPEAAFDVGTILGGVLF